MKKFCVLAVLLLGVLMFNALTTEKAAALPAFNKGFKAHYESNAKLSAAAKEAKCNVCHVKGEKKKVRNEYGKALSKFITKKDYNELKGDKEKLNAKITAALESAEKEKSSIEGKSYGDLIEAGELPGGDKDGKR